MLGLILQQVIPYLDVKVEVGGMLADVPTEIHHVAVEEGDTGHFLG